MPGTEAGRRTPLRVLRGGLITRRWLATLLAAALFHGCGGEREEDSGRSSAAIDVQDGSWRGGPSKPSANHLPCTTVDEPANFPIFTLGPEFEGLPLSGINRVCARPPEPGDRENLRAIRGAQAMVAPGRAELYTGTSTVVIHGRRELKLAATNAVAPAPTTATPQALDEVAAEEPAELPPPAPSALLGELRCDAAQAAGAEPGS